MLRNTMTAWGTPAKFFHWVAAALIIFLLAYGWWMTHMTPRSGRLDAYHLHSVVGYYAFLLIALRLLWRAANPTPALPPATVAWERMGAHASHALLYLFTIALTLTGWIMVGVGRRPIEATVFGLPVPLVTRTPDRRLHDILEDTHRVLAYILLAVIVIHVLAALRHHYFKRNDIMRRMWFARG
jgi:cytochrome b561